MVQISKQRLAEEIRAVVAKEDDPELTCLEARHLVERRMALQHNELLAYKSAFVEVFQSMKAPAGLLSRGEVMAHAIAFTGSGSTLVDRPHDQGLTAPHIACSKDSFNIR